MLSKQTWQITWKADHDYIQPFLPILDEIFTNPIKKQILMFRLGFVDGTSWGYKKIGKHLDISRDIIRQTFRGAMKKVKAFERLQDRKLMQERQDNVPQIDVRNKQDGKIIAEGISKGVSFKEIGKLAGSVSKNPEAAVMSKIKNDPELRLDIIQRLQQKRDEAINAMSELKAEEASYQQLATSVGIIIDKIQLLKGEPTNIIEEMPRMVIREREVIFEPRKNEVGT